MTDPLTPAELDALEAEHTPTVVPPCPVCGAPLTLSIEVADCGRVYHCSSAEAATTIRPDWRGMREHRNASEWLDAKRPDPRIIRLVAEVRARREGAL